MGGGKGAKEHENEKGMEKERGIICAAVEGQFWGQICREFAFSQQNWLIPMEAKILGIDRKCGPKYYFKSRQNNNMDEGDGAALKQFKKRQHLFQQKDLWPTRKMHQI